MNPIIYSKIFNEVKKNIKLIIRNWSSLVVIILGPLILLALVGYALSGSEIHDLSVGLITNEQSIVSDLQQVMQETATIVSYNLIDDCIDDMKFEKIELCVVIRGNFKPVAKDLASGEVTFYYDNTRPKVTLLLLTAFKQQLGLTSEQIGVTSAGVILNDLSDFVGFLGARINDIGNIEEQTGKIKLDLEQRLINLLEINRSFTPNYLIIKKIQNDLLVNISLNNSLNDSLNDLNKLNDFGRGGLNSSIEQLRKVKDLFQTPFFNLSTDLRFLAIDALLDDLIKIAENVSGSIDTNLQQIEDVVSRLNLLVEQLDLIQLTLHSEIQRTKEYITLIDDGNQQIQVTLIEAKEKMNSLITDDPNLIEKLIKPITQFFKPLIVGIKDFHVAFSLLLSTVVMFMSMTVGNIITLLEINNKARIRNLLAPSSNLIFVLGIILTGLMIITLQSMVLLILGQVTFGLQLLPVIFNIFSVLFLLCLIFVSVGIIIAHLAPTIESSLLFGTILSLLFFLFSDALQAIQQMPALGYFMARLNPLVISEMLLRKVIFLQISIFGYPVQLFLLVFYAIISIVVVLIISTFRSKLK